MHTLLYPVLATAVYLGLTFMLIAGSVAMPRLGFYGRLLASYWCLLVCSIYGVVASLVLRAVGHAGLSQWAVARAFKYAMKYTTGVEFVVHGAEHLQTRPAVLIGNHQTELDVLMLGAIFPPYCSVTAKKDLKKVPFLGQFMSLSNTVFIDRGNRSNAMSAFDEAALHMRRARHSVFIFPEGTRSYYTEPDLLPFKKGAFHFAIKAQVPIVPMVAANYADLLRTDRRIFTSGTIPVQVLPPIPTTGLTAADVDELAQRTREAMLEALVRITAARKEAMPSMNGSSTGVDVPQVRKRDGVRPEL